MNKNIFLYTLLLLSLLVVLSCGKSDEDNNERNNTTEDNNNINKEKEKVSVVALWQLSEIEDNNGIWVNASTINSSDSYIELCSDGTFNCYGKPFGWGRGTYKGDDQSIFLYFGQTLYMTFHILSLDKSIFQVEILESDGKTRTNARLKSIEKSQALKDIDILRGNLVGNWRLTEWGDEGNWKKIDPVGYDYGYYAFTFYEYGSVECHGLNTSKIMDYDFSNVNAFFSLWKDAKITNVSDNYFTITIDQQFGNYLRLRYTKLASSDPLIDPAVIEARRLAAFKDSLCSGVKFVTRQYKRSSFFFTPIYDIIHTQTDYVFKSDGTGVKKFIELTTTDQGYLASEEKFTWTVSGEKEYSIRIFSEYAISTTWNNVTIGRDILSTGDGLTLYKEKLFNMYTTEPSDIASYSVTNMYTQIYSSVNTARGCYVSPCLLTFYFKDGKITRFLYANFNARAASITGYYMDGSYDLKDGKLYLVIGYRGDDELMWPMFSLEDRKISKGNYWIPIGTYIARTDGLVPIDNDIKYDFPFY